MHRPVMLVRAQVARKPNALLRRSVGALGDELCLVPLATPAGIAGPEGTEQCQHFGVAHIHRPSGGAPRLARSRLTVAVRTVQVAAEPHGPTRKIAPAAQSFMHYQNARVSWVAPNLGEQRIRCAKVSFYRLHDVAIAMEQYSSDAMLTVRLPGLA